MCEAPEAATLLELSATQAVARMSRGELSAERYAEVLLARCSTARALNAFISFEPQRVLEAARARDRELRRGVKPGPLFGLPMPIKDSLNTQDYPTTAGTPAMRRFQPARDAPVVAAMRAAGAIVLGKTNLHELSFGWTSNNLSFGAVHNPYDAAHIPGGSSGGTAAAVAARLAPLGISEDTEGSIRVPAALCGICGFRPTTGRYSSAGCVPISQLFDQVGPHARSMADLILFDSVAADDWRSLEATLLRGVRLGVVRDYFFTDLDPQVERLTTLALERLAAAGAEIVDTQLPGLARLIGRTTNQVQNHDVLIELARYLEENGSALKVEDVLRQASPDIQSVFKAGILPGGDVVTEGEYAAARDQYLPDLRRLYHDYFARTGVAAVVFPATLVPAPRIGEETAVDIGGRSISFKKAIARNTAPGSTAGLPGLVLPAGIAGRLPVALEFDAPSGADRTLLSLGLSLEQALGPIPAPRL
jgi:indoleacetamide hydrolase